MAKHTNQPRLADRDMFMRFRGGGIGHIYMRQVEPWLNNTGWGGAWPSLKDRDPDPDLDQDLDQERLRPHENMRGSTEDSQACQGREMDEEDDEGGGNTSEEEDADGEDQEQPEIDEDEEEEEERNSDRNKQAYTNDRERDSAGEEAVDDDEGESL